MTTLSAEHNRPALTLNRWKDIKQTGSRSRSTIFVMPKLGALAERLSFVRDYPSQVLAAILTSIALFLFIPTYLINKNLKTQLQKESVSLAQQVQSLSATAVSADQMSTEKERLQALQEDAEEIKRLALQSTQRELLRYDVFPEPDPNMGFSSSIFHLFGQAYRNGIDKLIARVNGRDCPTQAEVNRSLEESLLRTGRRGFAKTTLSRDPIESGYGRYMSRIEREIVDAICKDRAKSISVYVNPTDLSGYDYWADYDYPGKEEAIKDCWYHQLAYWVIEDLFDTIEAMNAGYDNVLTAPVKRLQNVTFTMGLRRPGAGGRVFTGSRKRSQKKESEIDRPAYVYSAKDGLTESCTGRYCDENLDVIHFNASFLLKSEAVLPFMKELCNAKEHQFSGFSGDEAKRWYRHNQITILESSLNAIDAMDGDHKLYRYGQGMIVELNLVCEYIFYKEGYDEIKPDVVKNELQQE